MDNNDETMSIITNNSDNRSYEYFDEHCESYEPYLGFLTTYYVPFIVALGLVGNFLSCIVFLATQLKTRSSSYYLAALAAADFTFLSVLIVVHFSFNDIIDVYNRDGFCQFFVYISSVCASLSVWLIVAFTVERFIAVQYPLQRPRICTVSRAKMIVTSLVTVAMTSQLYVFWSAGIINQNNYDECEMLPDYQNFMSVVNMIDTVVTLIIPLTLIVVMNTMIAHNLILFSRRVQVGRVLDDSSFENSKEATELQIRTNSQSCSSKRFASQQRVSVNSSYRTLSHPKSSRDYEMARSHMQMCARNTLSPKSRRNIMRMLLVIDSVFVGLNLPSYGIRLYGLFGYELRDVDLPMSLWCYQQFAMLLYYTNFSINFILYAMCGITFRRRMWQLLRNKLKRLTRKPCQRPPDY